MFVHQHAVLSCSYCPDLNDMVDFRTVKTAVKLTSNTMSNFEGHCRGCYSSERLETLFGTLLDLFTLICNIQIVDNENIQILTCPRCYEFLKQIHRFRTKCHEINDIFLIKPDTKDFDVESVLKQNAIVRDPSHMEIKTEPIDDHDEIDEINVQINKVEVDYGYENSQQMIQADIESNNVVSDKNELNMRENQNMHKTEKLFACDHCNYSHKRKQLLGLHMLNHFCSKPFKCDKCSFTAPTKYRLNSHNKMKHSDERPFACDHCGYRSKIKSQLAVHIQKNHIKMHKKGNVFVCGHCDFQYKTRRTLVVHLMDHIGLRPFKCDKCSYTTVDRSRLNLHDRRKHNNEKPFECDYCGHQTKTKGQLADHIEIHTVDSQQRIKCSECSFTTTRDRYLKIHIARKHSLEKPFSCDQCDYRGRVKSNLILHKRNHMKTADYPFKCTRCPYKAITHRNLKYHIIDKH